MLRIIQIITLTIVGVLVLEFSILAYHIGEEWWLALFPPLVFYISFLSKLFFKDKDIWLNKVSLNVWSKFMEHLKPAAILFVVLFIITLCNTIVVVRTWPADKNFLIAQVYEGSPVPGKFKIGVQVILNDITNNKETIEVVNSSGEVKFETNDNLPIFATIIVKVLRNGKHYRGAIPGFTIPNLPHFTNVNISDIPNDGWVLDQELSDTVDVEIPKVTLGEKSPIVKILPGNAEFLTENNPYGIPNEDASDIVFHREAYSLGYDTGNKIPTWVSYKVSLSPSHNLEMRPKFSYDLELDKKLQASSRDYSGSGYDRGHLVSPKDVRFRGQKAVNESYFMSTISPQVPKINRGLWFYLERYTRDLCDIENEIFVTAGPAFIPDSGYKKIRYFVIGINKIAVPTHFFRIILRHKADEKPDVIAFLIPNSIPNTNNLVDYLISVDEIEALTGLDFFAALSDQVEAYLERKTVKELW